METRFDDFRKMSVWQLGFDLLVTIYRVTQTFPSDERFGLISDMRRAANSIAHNIAEGYGRFESRDKTRFYKISRGSAFELMSQLLVSNALGYLVDEGVLENNMNLCNQIIKELNSLIKTHELRNR